MLNREYDIFEYLNDKLKDQNLELTVICVGGFVLSHYGMRTTQDINGFYETSQIIDDIIAKVGDKFHINTADECWLNNSVQNLNPKPSEDICNILYDFSNLKVLTPPLEYIAGMKLTSARGIDIEDVASILLKLEIDSPDLFLEKLESYGFHPIDESLLLESFGLAYGMEWLENYYVTHEEDIITRIKSH